MDYCLSLRLLSRADLWERWRVTLEAELDVPRTVQPLCSRCAAGESYMHASWVPEPEVVAVFKV